MRDEFFKVCSKAKPVESHFCSLYVSEPFYGGPEEGGWWGHDTRLIASQEFNSIELAEMAENAIKELAEKANQDAKRDFSEQCRAEVDWLEARGLDADYLPEVNGEATYFTCVETQSGSLEHQMDRHYC